MANEPAMETALRRLIELAGAQDRLLRTFELDCVCQQFERDAAVEGSPWVPWPQATRVRVLVDERDADAPMRRFRADYAPQIVRWINGAAPHAVSHETEIGDGHRTTSYRAERRFRPSVHLRATNVYLTGERFLLCRFGRRRVDGQVGPVEAEPVRLARAILEPERVAERRSASWETLDDGSRALRLEQEFTGGGRHVYWLDPERGYALRHFDETDAGGGPGTQFTVESFTQVAADFWYPARAKSNRLNPSPRRTSPVRVERDQLPVGLRPTEHVDGAVYCVSTMTMRTPGEDCSRWTFEFSNVRVDIDIPPDAFEFHPPQDRT